MVMEVKSEEGSLASEPFTTVSHTANSAEEMHVNEGCKSPITGHTRNKGKENLVKDMYPKKVRNMLFYY